MYTMGSRREYSFSLWLYTTVFWAQIYAINPRVMENTENNYTGRNIYILSNSQAAI
jgi:hypothetical protein